MPIEPWNLDLARVAKQVAFDAVGFCFLYLIVVAGTWRARPAWLRAGGSLVFGLLFLACATVTAPWLAAPLLARAEKATRDAEATQCGARTPTLVVLGGGAFTPEVPSAVTHMRIVEAAKRVKTATQEKRKLTVVLSGGNDGSLPVSEAQIMKRALFLEIGETGRDHVFLLEDKSRNTYQNAALTRELLQKRKTPLSIVLVTSALHLPRAKGTFERQGFKVCAVAAPSAELSPRGLASFHAGSLSVAVLNEWIGLWGYRVKGWN
jgi:uncharacterized SAM-binding protein YcdF (DUF218 family)